ncbi:hypothetical protein RCC89_19535 [Cytophagaceae bacterium ABcell3]|nr:hypothetical protein RCC89_19535 [Cytophagaceae bacterium ABcell3]
MSFAGMTVNERLFASGLYKEFESAKKQKNKERVIAILKEINVDEPSINKILKEIGIK